MSSSPDVAIFMQKSKMGHGTTILKDHEAFPFLTAEEKHLLQDLSAECFYRPLGRQHYQGRQVAFVISTRL